MQFDSQHKNERDTLESLITYFGCTIPHLPEVKLGKLIYIAKLYHYANYGELLTGIQFFSLSYGPHAPVISRVIKKQLASNAICLERSRTSADPTFSNPVMIIKSCEAEEKKLSIQCLTTVREVVEDWGEKSVEELVYYTTRTIPFLSTAFRDPIDLKIINRFRGLKHALSLTQRALIHRFVETNDEEVDQDIIYSESCPVSMNEMAEIFLALRGDTPEKVPSREHLGFDAPAALEAFAGVGDRAGEITGQQPTDIDKAARLTYALLDSMCFRHYSARVALLTGILFLKRCGYYFGKETLEENWPQGCEYYDILEWFKKVSIKKDDAIVDP